MNISGDHSILGRVWPHGTSHSEFTCVCIHSESHDPWPVTVVLGTESLSLRLMNQPPPPPFLHNKGGELVN